MTEETAPAYLLLTLLSDELNCKLEPLQVYLTVAYAPEFAKLQMLDSIDLNLEGERRKGFVVSVKPAPGAVSTGCLCFTLDGKRYDPAKALAERLIRFKRDLSLLQDLLRPKPAEPEMILEPLLFDYRMAGWDYKRRK